MSQLAEVRGLLVKTAFPVTITYLGFMVMSLTDLMVLGRVSPEATAGLGVGASIFSWGLIFGIGLLAGMDFPVSHAHGAGNAEKAELSLLEGLRIATLFNIPATALLYLLSQRLEWFGLTPAVVEPARVYLEILAFSLWPAHVFGACRNYLQAVERTSGPMIVLIGANILNLVLNLWLVFGGFGVPALGVAGSAWSTFIARYFMALVVVWMCRGALERVFRARLNRLEVRREILALGIPSAFQMSLEVGVFALFTLLAGRLGTAETAAHQIVLNTASLTFMVPLGLGAATAVLVGQSLGRGNRVLARQIGWMSFRWSAGFMSVSAALMLIFPTAILGAYTTSTDVIEVGKKIILVAGIFQISDGAQTVLAGALRGISETRISMWANLLGHWAVGFPVGLGLAFYFGMGLFGLWVGLAAGLTAVALLLLVSWFNRSK